MVGIAMIPVYDDNGEMKRYNIFHASLIVRYAENKKCICTIYWT